MLRKEGMVIKDADKQSRQSQKKCTHCSKPIMMKVMKLECKTKVELSEMLDSNNT